MMGKAGAMGTALCAVHGKMRSWDCLIETGAGPVCAPGSQCKSSTSKDTPCKFWMEGRCAKGIACPFLHGDGPAECLGGMREEWAAKPHSKGEGCGGPCWGPGKDWSWGKPDWGSKGWGKGWADDWGKGPPSWAPPQKGACKGMGKEPDARATCAVHGKLRSIACLEDRGDGQLVCKEGSQCQAAAEGGIKRAFCKFFAQGICQRGEACTFAHSEQEIGTLILAGTEPLNFSDPVLAPQGGIQPGFEETDEFVQALSLMHGKRNGLACLQEAGNGSGGYPCKSGVAPIGSKGKGCSKGCKAGFAAGDFFWGPNQAVNTDPQVMCSVHGKMRRVAYLEESADGSYTCKQGFECQNTMEGGVKRAMCKFFQQGTCTRGDVCAFAHSEMEIGLPIPDGALVGLQEVQHEDWKGGKGGKGVPEEKAICSVHNKQRTMSCLQDVGHGAFACRPGCECKGVGIANGPRPPCKFYAQGNCHKGEACPFTHDAEDWSELGYAPIGSMDARDRYAPY